AALPTHLGRLDRLAVHGRGARREVAVGLAAHLGRQGAIDAVPGAIPTMTRDSVTAVREGNAGSIGEFVGLLAASIHNRLGTENWCSLPRSECNDNIMTFPC